jgi:hypothetical protein
MEHQPDEKMIVEFYPSIEDNVHVAARVGASVTPKTIATYAYQLFLLVNAIIFPAFLIFSNLVLLGAVVFLLNLVVLAFIVRRASTDSIREYYRRIYGNRENRVARVELTQEGIKYSADGGWSFWPWRRITAIEETRDSIFFYFDGNGFGVRTSGFAYDEEMKTFLQTARTLRTSAKELAE